MYRLVAEVVIDGAAGSFDKCYTYAIPDKLKNYAKPGCRVTIPFGKGNLKKQGMILSVYNGEVTSKTKEIYSVTDKEPILNDEMIKMCKWLKGNVFCTYFDAIHTMLPAGLNYKLSDFYSANVEFCSPSLLSECEREIFDFLLQSGEQPLKKLEQLYDNANETLLSLVEKQAVIKNQVPTRRMQDMTRRWVKINYDKAAAKLTDRQQEIYDIVDAAGSVSVKELQYFTGVSASVIAALEKKGVLISFEKQEFRLPNISHNKISNEQIVLTNCQQAAYDGLSQLSKSPNGETALLYGVTGSGKTKVFLKLVDEVSSRGEGVIIMVPEIALTPQMIKIFSSRYGSKIAVFHSAMSLGQRMDEWRRIKQGKALIAIGTRSAVFAPFKKLGLIVIDEEQEHTYKSEKSPRFHARDLARFRSAYHKCLVCLASATPSVESYSAAKSGKYKLFTLSERYGDAVLPEVSLVDMKKELSEGNSSDISRELAVKIGEALDNNNQAIILLNRRGHNTYVSCSSCGWVASCENCSISLTYHSANRRLMCHYCGASHEIPKKCPECGSEFFHFSGSGTQKLEEELKLLFPKARILRLDADSTGARDSYSNYLTAFANGEYDIMLGTQMVAKGLDFPRVTVVGVIGADRALYSDDYRGYERTFSLLTQVVGRAGRSENAGVAVIQTNDTDNNIISLAQQQNYDAFFKEEILNRKLMIFPPFCDICMVYAQSYDATVASDTINEVFANIKQFVADEYSDIKLIILGPSPATVPKVNNKYRYRIIIKTKNSARFREMIRAAIEIKLKRDTYIGVDINPENII
ncbi:MAG: primosomal protein N' [Ruminococcaceae bacterium]|nr:primosomal protein N' [Oscillospiraceae bacterium]